MNCQRIRDLLPLYADDELEAPYREIVSEHLKGCEECLRRLAVDREACRAASAGQGCCHRAGHAGESVG